MRERERERDEREREGGRRDREIVMTEAILMRNENEILMTVMVTNTAYKNTIKGRWGGGGEKRERQTEREREREREAQVLLFHYIYISCIEITCSRQSSETKQK